jgi:dihydroorotase
LRYDLLNWTIKIGYRPIPKSEFQNTIMKSILIKNGQLVNRGQIVVSDLLIKNGFIVRIDKSIDVLADIVIDAEGKYVLPGIIDDQVHFREPGLTHKADIRSESRAAVAGGVTSFMEMPNTNPTSTTQALLQAKYDVAAASSMANYSFFMGATNDNLEEVLKTNAQEVCGVKVFMGSSTGNMLVDNKVTLSKLFKECPMLIATHCEDEATVRERMEIYKKRLGNRASAMCHPKIRNTDACYLSSAMAIELARKHNTRLHILHISTAKEVDLFRNDIPLVKKRITSEACVHHLYFNEGQYRRLGNLIKCNPAIKSKADQVALWAGLMDDRLDIIATDHAPHTWEEKQQDYWSAPSGLPLVQHSLNVMLDFYHRGMIGLERIVQKMCHAPADCFNIEKRGYLDEGNWADVVILDLDKKWKVEKQSILYKCGWSPLEGKMMHGKVDATVVSGSLVWQNNQFLADKGGERMKFHVTK